jgi:hypothetical protein
VDAVEIKVMPVADGDGIAPSGIRTGGGQTAVGVRRWR